MEFYNCGYYSVQNKSNTTMVLTISQGGSGESEIVLRGNQTENFVIMQGVEFIRIEYRLVNNQ